MQNSKCMFQFRSGNYAIVIKIRTNKLNVQYAHNYYVNIQLKIFTNKQLLDTHILNYVRDGSISNMTIKMQIHSYCIEAIAVHKIK